MYQGSCLCGTVKYQVRGELGPIGLCHCSRCRKANGTAFLAAAQVDPQEFSRRPGLPEVIRLRIGTLDTPPQGSVQSHMFFDDRTPWFPFSDDAPKYSERPA